MPVTVEATTKCLCGCGYDVPTSMEKQRGRPRLFYSEQCATRFRVRKHRDKALQSKYVTDIDKSTLFFSGIEKAATADILVREDASGMMSQLLYRPQLLAACGNIPLVMDSGAYSKELTKRDVDGYAALVQRLGKRCIWYASCDVIGDQEKSNAHYHYLLSLLPEDLHSRILWIYQASAPISYLYQAVREHVRIGVGGLVPLFQSPNKALAYQKIREVAGIIMGAGREIVPHYFGVSIPQVIQELHGYHRVFSVDSTTWLIGGKYGLLVARNGKQQSAKELGYDFATEELLRQNVRTMKKWMEKPEYCSPVTPFVAQTSWLEAV